MKKTILTLAYIAAATQLTGCDVPIDSGNLATDKIDVNYGVTYIHQDSDSTQNDTVDSNARFYVYLDKSNPLTGSPRAMLNLTGGDSVYINNLSTPEQGSFNFQKTVNVNEPYYEIVYKPAQRLSALPGDTLEIHLDRGDASKVDDIAIFTIPNPPILLTDNLSEQTFSHDSVIPLAWTSEPGFEIVISTRFYCQDSGRGNDIYDVLVRSLQDDTGQAEINLADIDPTDNDHSGIIYNIKPLQNQPLCESSLKARLQIIRMQSLRDNLGKFKNFDLSVGSVEQYYYFNVAAPQPH